MLNKDRNLHGHSFVLKMKAYKQDTLNVVSVKVDTVYVYTGPVMITLWMANILRTIYWAVLCYILFSTPFSSSLCIWDVKGCSGRTKDSEFGPAV